MSSRCSPAGDRAEHVGRAQTARARAHAARSPASKPATRRQRTGSMIRRRSSPGSGPCSHRTTRAPSGASPNAATASPIARSMTPSTADGFSGRTSCGRHGTSCRRTTSGGFSHSPRRGCTPPTARCTGRSNWIAKTLARSRRTLALALSKDDSLTRPELADRASPRGHPGRGPSARLPRHGRRARAGDLQWTAARQAVHLRAPRSTCAAWPAARPRRGASRAHTTLLHQSWTGDRP